MLKEFYLVPFGREPGGYLDVLGLPPNAPMATVSEHSKKYRQRLRAEFRTQVKELAAKQTENQITREEFDAQKAKLDSDANKREADFNKLKDSYDQQIAQQRGLKRSGQQEEVAGWVPLLRGLDGDFDTLRHLLARRRPLPRLSKEFLRQVAQRWLDSPRARKSPGPDLPSSTAQPTPTDLKTLFMLMTERDVIGLLWADALWSRLEGTNRDHWQQQVQLWLDEIREIGPHLRRRAEKGAGQSGCDYPSLSAPRKPIVAHLPEGAPEEAEPALERGRDRPLDWEKFSEVARALGMEPEQLKELLGGAGPGHSEGANPFHDNSEPPFGGNRAPW